jgi:hypothetical protein
MPPIVSFPGGPTISQREFSMASLIRVGAKSMTATVVNLRQGRFLFIARHGIKSYPKDPIEQFWDGAWHQVNVDPVENPDLDYDVVAARISDALTDRPYDEFLLAGNLFVSQEVYFLGYPLGLLAIAQLAIRYRLLL